MQFAHLLGALRRKGRVHDPARAWTGPADATPIHGMLDQRGVPWRLTRAQLAGRYGVTGDIIQVATPRPFLPGLVRPLATSAAPDLPQDAPAGEFVALTRFGDDSTESVRRTAEEVALYLGRARVTRTGSVSECLWRFGPASLALRSTRDGCEICIRTA